MNVAHSMYDGTEDNFINKSMMQFDKEPSIYYVSKGLRGWVKKVDFFFLTFNSIFADEILGGWVDG